MESAAVGLLPLSIRLYDQALPQLRRGFAAFARTIQASLEQRGLRVVSSPICCQANEFSDAVTGFEQEGVDAIVTLHLAYSPSLESADVLARTHLPLVVLDTTPRSSFGPGTPSDEIMYNHGIHGVQDLCNLLLRKGKAFEIESGHWERSDVLDRVVRDARGARMATRIRRGRVGRVGRPFAGMGDFAVTDQELRQGLGAHAVDLGGDRLRSLCASVTDGEARQEVAADLRQFDAVQIPEETHLRSVRLGLALRRWMEEERLDAFTVNFLEATREAGLETVPFLEASKAMARGIGYAGEGDVVTALLVASLCALSHEVSFTEMFCPDWEGNSVFLSHMGEASWSVLERPELREREYRFSDTGMPAYVSGCFRAGQAALVNLAPMGGAAFRLIVAPGALRSEPPGPSPLAASVRGWFAPRMRLGDFLAEYSRRGGTHHLGLIYTDQTRELETFGRMMGFGVEVLS